MYSIRHIYVLYIYIFTTKDFQEQIENIKFITSYFLHNLYIDIQNKSKQYYFLNLEL